MMDSTDIHILQLVASGLKHEAIAVELEYSYRTIKRRLGENIYPALGVACAPHAVYEGMKRGLIA